MLDNPENFQKIANDLLGKLESKDYETLHDEVKEIKDQLEIVLSSGYSQFLTALLPGFKTILGKIEPQFLDSQEQKIRQMVIEIMQRLPTKEILKPHSAMIMNTCLEIITKDNQENAILATKIAIDLHRALRNMPDKVQPLMEIILDMYRSFPDLVKRCEEEAKDKRNTESISAGSPLEKQDQSRMLQIKGTESFKVICEFPLLLVILQQVYPNEVDQFKAELIKVTEKALLISPSEFTNLKSTKLSSKFRHRYTDLILVLVKTVSFWAYMVRSPKTAGMLENQKNRIPEVILKLLLDCPTESISARKELLVILSRLTNAKCTHEFVGHIDKLLDDEVLLGTSRTSRESLRPFAYNTMVELIDTIKSDLSPEQIEKIIDFYVCALNDLTLSMYVQHQSAKLLVRLLEKIHAMGNETPFIERKNLLLKILKAFVTKTKTLSSMIQKAVHKSLEEKNQDSNSSQEVQPMQIDEDMLKDSKSSTDSSEEPESNSYSLGTDLKPSMVKDCRSIFHTLVCGMRNCILVLFRIRKEANTSAGNISSDEIALYISSLKHGIDCFPVLTMRQDNGVVLQDKKKEQLDTFASQFVMLPPDVFKEIFNRQLEHLYEKILEDQTNLPFPTVLLSNDHVAAYFSDMLLNFLTARMDRMQGLTNESNMLLRLFKLVFGSIVTFCNHENVLNKHLNKIVNSCLEYSSQNKESTNYFLTLRALFRSIVSGKLDLVREDFGRLVNKVLDKLTSLLKVCTKSPLRDLLIELCLTIPVKLNVLCPHLGKLTRPLLCALNGGPDLAVLGLKHLESWVDSLKTDVLEPFLKPIMPELLIALFSHLRPPGPQHQHGVLAMRILAKLGGHNRKYFSQSSCVEIHKNPEEGMQVLINFNTGNETKKKGLKLSLDHFIRTAAQSILTSPDENCRRYAYSLCRSCLIALLDLQGNAKQDFKISDDYKGFELTKTIFTVQSSNNFFDPYTVEDKSRAPKTQTRVRAESSLFKKLVFTMFAACADGKLKEEAKPFAKWFCQHYMLVILGNTKPPHGQLELNPDIVVDALVEVFCSENIENFMPVGEEYLVGMISMSKQLLGTVERASHLRLWDKFAYRFCHSCAKVQWFKKLGGCRGILTLANNLSPFWVITREVEFVKGLIFILKESNLGAMSTMVEEGRSALRRIITICHTPENMKQAERQVENLQLTASGHNIIQRKFLEIRTSFVQELSSAHESVRETVQSILQLLSDLMGKSITELLKQDFQANLSNTVTAKRFDALGLSLQTGFCEAVRFFISLDPPLLPLNPQIMDIISIALKMTEHPKEARTAREFDPKVQANLQLSCVRLLCAALNNPDMQQNEQKFEHARQAIIERFFALLQSDNEKIVFAVKQGLSTYISQQHLKKELLQSCLRPILSTLGHHQYLKISVLSTLKHLLELCTNYFNVKLGEQLLAHLRTWKTKEQIVGDDDPVERGAKLLELFSFLPQDCKQLLDSLVPLTHDLEAEWKIEYSNVFREPLARYLKQYPEATINYFFSPSPQGKEPISESHNFSLFLSVISFDFASPIAEHIASNYEDFLKKMCLHDYSLGNEPVQHYIHDFEMQFKGLVILKKLAKLQPQWMASTTIVDSLRKLWLNPQLRQVELENRHSLSFDLLKKYRTILKCFMNIYQHCKDMSTKVDILYLTLHALTDNYLASDSYFLKDFYDRHIVKNYDTEQKEAILSRFVEQFESSEETQEYKVKALQNLIFPGLSAAFERNQENVLNRKLVGSVVETLFSGQNNNIEESLRVELLQLATLFVTYIPDVIFVDRKHIIRFAYNHIRNQDTTSKQCASVLAARFIKAYDTPHKDRKSVV